MPTLRLRTHSFSRTYTSIRHPCPAPAPTKRLRRKRPSRATARTLLLMRPHIYLYRDLNGASTYSTSEPTSQNYSVNVRRYHLRSLRRLDQFRDIQFLRRSYRLIPTSPNGSINPTNKSARNHYYTLRRIIPHNIPNNIIRILRAIRISSRSALPSTRRHRILLNLHGGTFPPTPIRRTNR